MLTVFSILSERNGVVNSEIKHRLCSHSLKDLPDMLNLIGLASDFVAGSNQSLPTHVP